MTSKQTLMRAFYLSTDFKIVRGTSSGVSYKRMTKRLFPEHSRWCGSCDYIIHPKSLPQRHPGVGLPPM